MDGKEKNRNVKEVKAGWQGKQGGVQNVVWGGRGKPNLGL